MFKNLNYGDNNMTREQYLELKEELKDLSRKIRWDKRQLRSDMSSSSRGLGCVGHEPIYRQQSMLRSLQQDYRYKHVFMSLLRGKTRAQIENNFGHQQYNPFFVEHLIQELCTQYNLECDLDENLKVMTVKRKQEVVAA